MSWCQLFTKEPSFVHLVLRKAHQFAGCLAGGLLLLFVSYSMCCSSSRACAGGRVSAPADSSQCSTARASGPKKAARKFRGAPHARVMTMLLGFAWLAVPSHAWLLPRRSCIRVPRRGGGGVALRAGGVSDGGAGSLDDEVNAALLAALPTPTEPDASIPPTRLAQLFARGLQASRSPLLPGCDVVRAAGAHAQGERVGGLSAVDRRRKNCGAISSAVYCIQRVDSPTENAGLENAFPFMTFECRKAVTARQGATSVELFIEHGRLSPALAPFMHCAALKWGEPTFTDGTATRGALASFPVEVLRDKGLRHPSGFQVGKDMMMWRRDRRLISLPFGTTRRKSHTCVCSCTRSRTRPSATTWCPATSQSESTRARGSLCGCSSSAGRLCKAAGS